ncbi:hypothetical protein AB7M22_001401 [Pseudomonas sp. ADAK2 TE3594]
MILILAAVGVLEYRGNLVYVLSNYGQVLV